MRNLAEYPITTQEKIDALNYAINMINNEYPDLCGDTKAAALLVILEDLCSAGVEDDTPHFIKSNQR